MSMEGGKGGRLASREDGKGGRLVGLASPRFHFLVSDVDQQW